MSEAPALIFFINASQNRKIVLKVSVKRGDSLLFWPKVELPKVKPGALMGLLAAG